MSDNYGTGETTSIQSSRSLVDAKCAGPYPCGQKFRRHISGAHTSPHNPRFQCQEGKSPQLLAVKTSGDWVDRGDCWSPKQFLLGNPLMNSRMQIGSLWASAPQWQLCTRVVYREILKCLALGQAESIVLCWAHLPTELVSWYHIWDSINLANIVWLTWEIHRSSTPPNLWAHSSRFSIRMACLGSQILSNKQQLASVSPKGSQVRVTAWFHLGISKLSTNSSHLRLLCSSGRVLLVKHRWGLILACTTWKTPGPRHQVDSYRPLQSTTTLPLHSWCSTEGGGWWSAVTASLCSWLAWVNPSHWSANNDQGSTRRGG